MNLRRILSRSAQYAMGLPSQFLRRRSRRHQPDRATRRLRFIEFLEDRQMLSSSAQLPFLLLGPTAKNTLEVTGNGLINAKGGTAVVDSINASAVIVTGNGTLRVDDLNISGSPGIKLSGHGNFVGTVHAGVTPQVDPLASLPVPNKTAPDFNDDHYSSTLRPGTYREGIHISGNSSVTLLPGIYYVSGEFAVSGKAKVTGEGVTIYLADSSCDDAGFEISGQAVVSLSPATSGTYQGITIFQTRTNHAETKLSGNAVLNLVGSIYGSTSKLEVTGNAVLNGTGDSAHHIGSQFIGYNMLVSGNGKVVFDAGEFNSLSLSASLTPAPITLANGTLVTNAPNGTISGSTEPQATVALESTGDSRFDDGTATANASGNYSLPVVLTEGPNTLQVRATANGQQAFQTIQVTLDRVAPTITTTSPTAGLVTNQNVTVAGQITDDRSGVASLQAALDGGEFAPVSLGAGGSFSFATTLLLNHTADGAHTEHLKATDNAGNVSFFDVTFTLDTVTPTIAVTSPAALLITNQNVTVAGNVTDDRSGVASLQAALDGGGFAPVTLGAGGSLSFTTTLLLNHTADGAHTEHLKATDNAGNVSFFDVTFTLDSVTPTIAVTSPAAALVTNQNVTVAGNVADDRSGVASLQAALDGGGFAPVTLGAGGSFSFDTNVPLDHTADGSHTEHLRATDNAGNVSFFDVTFTLDTVTPTIAVTSPAAALVTNQNVTVAGNVTDDRSGVASLQAALDGGGFAPVTLGAGGSFSFDTNVPLDHTADGSHTEHLKATDNAGNVSFFDVSFTLDTVTPTIAVTSPVMAPFTNRNVTLTGQVTDDRSGVASLQAAVDGDAFAPLILGAGGSFSFASALPLDHSADGLHTEHLQASDIVGNVSVFDLSFTLDTIAPLVDFALDPATDTPPAGDGHTQQSVVTLSGNTEPIKLVTLQETGASTLSDGTGLFSFSGVALVLGDNVFTVAVTDEAGNIGTAQHTITRESPFITLVEDSRFDTPLEHTFAVPSQPSMLEFQFVNLNFDTQADFIRDAFEASLTDGSGNSLVLPIAGSRDAFLNITEGQSPQLSPNVQLHGDTLDVDLSHIPAGTQAVLHIRLVNNDADTATSVQVSDAQVIAGDLNTPLAVTPAVAVAAATSSVDFAALADVSSSMAATYGQTSLNEGSGVLYAGLTLRNTGNYPVHGPLLAVVTHLSDPSIRVRDSDGRAPDGLPYFVFTENSLAPGDATAHRDLAFFNPGGIQFSYDLMILGQLNRPPVFTSHPNREAIPGLDYVYHAAASDPDKDALRFALLTGPAGMTVDPVSGNLTWRPQQGDLGNQAVLLQVDDGQGGTTQQQYTVSTIVAPPNRPPVFISTPPIDGTVNSSYSYQAAALDRDGDALTFSVVSGPTGLTIDPATGLVDWTPGVNQSGESPVSLRVNDGHGGEATQTYTVVVPTDLANHSPVILSQPKTTAPFSAQDYQYQVQAIDPDGDPLAYALTTEPAGMTIDATSGLIHWNVPVAGQALQFFGGNSLITPNLMSSPFSSSSVTLELWFKANGPGVVVRELDTAPPNFPFQHDSLIEVVGNQVLVGVKGLAAVTLGSIEFGTWHHVALRYNESSHTLDGFLDGVKSATATTGSRTVPFPQFYQLGAGETNHLGSGAPFNGQADELRFWSVARSDSQITGNISQPLVGNESGLVAYYHLDEGAGTIAHDNSGHGKDANLLSDTAAVPPAWVVSAPLLQPTDNPVAVRVDDGRGGVDTQSYTLTFTHELSGVIEGTVFTDLNANGSRDLLNVPPPTTPFNLLIVPGAADPYLAGMPSGATADPGDTTANAAPFEVPGLSLVAGSSLMFSVPAGIVQLTPPLSEQIQPDGVSFGIHLGFVSHLAGAMNGISGITAPPGSVVGVFLGLDQPDLSPAPSALNFQSGVPGGLDYTSLSPQLKQVFFIGDGRTSSGQIQQVVVPAGATRLFLAVMDEAVWRDNGSLQTSFGFYGVDVRTFDASPSAPKYLKLVSVANQFAGMSGVTFTESLNQLVVSFNGPFGQPRNFDTLRADGTRVPFTAASGIFGQNSLASARSSNLGGFKPGDVFFGGPSGLIGRITDGGNTLINPWVTLPGECCNFDQGLAFDETGIFGGDLLAATVGGGVWRIDVTGHATKLAQTPYRLSGLTVIPDNAERYGPLAGKLVAVGTVGCCSYGVITVDTSGNVTSFDRDNFSLEGIHVVVPNENFFSADFGGQLYGASPDSLAPMVGEILLMGRNSGGIRRLFWDGTSVRTQLLDLDLGSFSPLPYSVGSDFTGTAGAGVVPPLSQELGTPGWVVYLDQNHNGAREADELFTTTDANGKYSFQNLTPIDYTVAVEGQPGFRVTQPTIGTYTVTVDPGHDVSGLDFGTAADASEQRGPKITSTPPTRTTVGQLVRYLPTVTNPDGRPLSFDLPLRPFGMTVLPDTGEIVWTASVAEFGPQNVILRVRDDRGNVDLQNFTLDVDLVDAAPAITSTPPLLAVAGFPYQYQVRAQDAENDPLSYALPTFPAGMSIDSVTGLVTYTPTATQLGAHAITIQVSDGQGKVTAQSYSLNVLASATNHPPTITSAPRRSIGIGQNYLYQVAVTDLDADPLTYSLPTAPAGMTIDVAGLVHWQPVADQIGQSSVTVRVDDGRGGAATQDFSITVSVQAANQPPQIVSSPVTVALVGQPYVYDAVANDPDGDPVIWDLVTAPDGMSLDPNLGTLRWTPIFDQLWGDKDVTLRATDNFGGSSTQSFRIGVALGNSPPIFQSLPLTQAAVNQPYSYRVAAIDVDGDPVTFTLNSAPAGMTITPITVPLDDEIESAFGELEVGTTIKPTFALIQWTPTAGQAGSQNAVVEIRDGHGNLTTQSWTVNVSTTPLNQPPTITPTPPLVATVDVPFAYQVIAADPEHAPLDFTLQAEPAGLTIDAVSGLIHWTPATAQLGQHTMFVGATDPAGGFAALVLTINVLATNEPPTITSTPRTTAIVGDAYDYDVHASDIDGDILTYVLATAPAGMTIDALGRITWSPTLTDLGSAPVQVTVSDGRGGVASQSFTISVASDTQAPRVTLELSSNPTNIGLPVTVIVNATDNVGVNSLTLTQDGVAIPLDPSGRVVISADVSGSLGLVAIARDAAGNSATASQTLVIADPHDASAPNVELSTPADNANISSPTDVIGTVTDDNLVFYTLSAAPFGTNNFTEFARGTAPVTNGVLGQFDPTMLVNDSYVLRLTAVDAGGHTSIDEHIVNVFSDLKLGNFTLSFTDLTIPVSGIPITVSRTYDSLLANQSHDIGFGWRIEFRDVDLRSSVAKTGAEVDGFFNPFKNGSRVYMTLPGGERQGFTFKPKVADGLRGAFIGIFEPRFEPDAGVKSSLTVDPADLRIDADGTVHDFQTGLPYNPASGLFGGTYLLTTKDGIAYEINGESGELTVVSDPNNNTMTFTDAGIVSSTGTGVLFERDTQGRIATIIDPMGNRIRYQYDAQGDLIAVTDRTNNTSQFVYRSTPAHYMDKVIDPLGRTGVRTDYDAEGRLIKLIDAAGNPVQLTHDVTHSIETVTDQLGHTTTYEYDNRGNTVTQIDALGAVTHRTYDADDNTLSETDPLGRTTTRTYDDRGDVLTQTDPLGNTTISTYQAFTFFVTALAASRGQAASPFTRPLTSTDPLGNTTSNTYDFFGGLQTTTDPLGNTTTVLNNAAGKPITVMDPLGNVSRNQYDGNGYRTQIIDAAGHVVHLTNDANGNPLSQAQLDGGSWSVSYNAEGRPTSLGLIGLPHTAHYDALNQITQITDPSGETSTLDYDAFGHMTEITLPDGTTAEAITYDAVGNLLSITDFLGNVTRYDYDADNQQIQTTNADGSTEKRAYDLAGELVEVTDALGNSTRYVYDGAGRRIQIIDVLGGIAETVYDPADRIVATVDPLGRTTRFQYDAAGEQVATVAPDGSIKRTAYDEAGRVVQTIDAAGNITSNAYDPNGNLISVTDALGNITRYEYDDGDQRVAITDALGNTTRFRYDTDGFLVETTQPDGETDTSTYDSAGQLASTTNGNGEIIHYGYDVRGRLTSLTLPDGTVETTTYTRDGLISAVSDADGTTRYDYDPVMRRLVRVTEPDGRYIRYAYDVRGYRTLMADGMGAGLPEDVTQYAYDALGRVIQVSDPQGGVTRYTYDANSNLTTTSLPNGVTETETYDTLNRLIDIIARDRVGATISRFSYTLDADGNRTREDDADGSHHVYDYDALDRVIGEMHFSPSGISLAAETYAYDAVGNMTSRSGTLLGNATFNYNGDNQVVSGDGSTYAYDAAGNLVSVTDSTGQFTRYSYDARRRLVSSQEPDGATTSYTYDFQGVRQSQRGPAGLVKYLVDAANGPGSAQLVRESDSAGGTLRTYVTGTRLVSLTEGGNVRYYNTDGLGSTRSLTDPTGVVTDNYSYSAYGVLLGHTGSSANPFGFAGQQQDEQSGLMYMRARYYDPATAHFLSRDAFAGYDHMPLSLNKYLYALANPVNHTDPSGNFASLVEAAMSLAQQAYEKYMDVQRAVNVVETGFRVEQYLGGFMTYTTVARAFLDPGKVGLFFGGFVVPISPLIGPLAGLRLAKVGWGLTRWKSYYIPSPPRPGEEGALAFVFRSEPHPPARVYFTPKFLLLPPLPTKKDWQKFQVGTIIHEFAHLTLNIGDIVYNKNSFYLLPGEAFYNADNYRLAVQGAFYGYYPTIANTT